jgi:ubiquinone/menaquinone biosynthesis C-methylase UbiE
MHDLPVANAAFDTVLLMHALTYTSRPGVVFGEVSRVLRPGGRLLAVTLQKHKHEKAVTPYNHLNLGFTQPELEKFCRGVNLEPVSCHVAAVEKRAPNFSILTLLAEKPAG